MNLTVNNVDRMEETNNGNNDNGNNDNGNNDNGNNDNGSNDTNDTTKKSTAPKIVFVVPYRDREHHLKFFSVYMKHILSDYDPSTYEIYIVHQKDGRPINRGGMKNIGF